MKEVAAWWGSKAITPETNISELQREVNTLAAKELQRTLPGGKARANITFILNEARPVPPVPLGDETTSV
jgi:hypothetical protein